MPDEQLTLFGPPRTVKNGLRLDPSFEGSLGGGVALAASVVVDYSVRELCPRRYPGHPRGCPNHGKKSTCPPRASLIGDLIDLDRPVWIAWNEFDLAAHVERLRAKHPDWSDRQLRCCLYWQPRARKQLALRIVAFIGQHDEGSRLLVVACPEANGVNVTETMRNQGVELEWPPVRVVRQVALLGYALPLFPPKGPQ